MFHRADPFVPGSEAAAGDGVARYSVRYVPGGTRVDGCYVRHAGNLFEMIGTVAEAEGKGLPVFPRCELRD